MAASSRNLLEDENAQGRQEQEERLRLLVAGDRRWGEPPHVAQAPAPVNRGVAIEDLLPEPPPGNAHANISKDLTAEVADDQGLVILGRALAQEGEHRVGGVVLEPGKAIG